MNYGNYKIKRLREPSAKPRPTQRSKLSDTVYTREQFQQLTGIPPVIAGLLLDAGRLGYVVSMTSNGDTYRFITYDMDKWHNARRMWGRAVKQMETTQGKAK